MHWGTESNHALVCTCITLSSLCRPPRYRDWWLRKCCRGNGTDLHWSASGEKRAGEKKQSMPGCLQREPRSQERGWPNAVSHLKSLLLPVLRGLHCTHFDYINNFGKIGRWFLKEGYGYVYITTHQQKSSLLCDEKRLVVLLTGCVIASVTCGRERESMVCRTTYMWSLPVAGTKDATIMP